VKAREAVESLEKLCSDHYRIKYKREVEIGFCGEQSAIPPEILSNGMLVHGVNLQWVALHDFAMHYVQ
jgi:hypothetical protein